MIDSELVARITNHLCRAIETAQQSDEPFQHFFVENILPGDVYAHLLGNFPGQASYFPLNPKRWKNKDGVSTRDQLSLSTDAIERIDANRLDFWKSLTKALMSHAFQQAVFARLKRDVSLRFKCAESEVLSKPAYPSVMLIRDIDDYRIKPHPDGQPRVVTMQLYLPEPGTRDDLGTSLYRKAGAVERLTNGKFVELKRFPFLPNSCYAIAINDEGERHSYHGRELIEGQGTVRNSIIITWLSRPELSNTKYADRAGAQPA